MRLDGEIENVDATEQDVNINIQEKRSEVVEEEFLPENLVGLEGAVGGVVNEGLDLVVDFYACEPRDAIMGSQLTSSSDSVGSNSNEAGADSNGIDFRGSNKKSKSRKKKRHQNGMV